MINSLKNLLSHLYCGSGTQKEYLSTLCKDLSIDDVTVFTGYIPHNKVQEYHNMLDIYVAVSLRGKVLELLFLEASACGKPVIVSNVGGLPEVVEHGKTGFIVEARNHIALAEVLEKLINKPELRNEMGANGRKRVVKEFNWSDSVTQMISIYNSLIS